MDLEPITTSECIQINQLKTRLLDLELQEKQLSNQELIRWIRARDHNVDNAEKMFRNSTSWRHEIDADGLLLWQPIEMFPRKFPFTVSGFGYQGDPVVILHFGKMDFRTALDEGYLKDGLKYLYKCLEQMLSLIRKLSTHQECLKKITVIIDMEGFQYRQLTSRKLLEEYVKAFHAYEDNFPETMQAVFIVNVNTMSAMMYRIASKVLNSKTLSKIQLHNSCKSKYSIEILKVMAPEEFPEKYGGTGLLSTNILLAHNNFF